MIHRLISFWSFAIAAAAIIVTFMVSTTYAQLTFAIVLYPLLMFIAYKVFLRDPFALRQTQTQTVTVKVPSVEISDADKRTFLKLIGSTGLFLLVYSFFNKRTGGLLPPQLAERVGMSKGADKNASIGSNSNEAVEGYKISEVDDDIVSYYGFINNDGAWYIMKADTAKGTFRYTRGETDFPKNWARRQALRYDYLNKVF